jgi:drug/metabolite transporter (DMT)-like permease
MAGALTSGPARRAGASGLDACARRIGGMSGSGVLPRPGTLAYRRPMTATPTAARVVPPLALPALFVGAVVIGMSGIYVRLADTGPVATAFYRVFLAAPLFWLAIAGWPEPRAQARARKPRRDLALLVVTGILFAVDLALWHGSMMLTTVANATILGNFAVVFVSLGAWWLLRERLTGTFFAGLAITLTGGTVLAGESARVSLEGLSGDLVALAAAVFYAGYLLCVAVLRARYSVVYVMGWSSVVSAVVLLPLAALTGEVLVATSLIGWLALVGISLGSQVTGQSLVSYALAHLPASFSAVGLLVQPVAAAAFAWVLLGEALTPWTIAGGCLVLVGVFVARRGSRGGKRR